MFEAMSRKEYKDLKSFFHFVNNNLDTSDTFTMVENLHDIMKRKLKRFVFSIIFAPLVNK